MFGFCSHALPNHLLRVCDTHGSCESLHDENPAASHFILEYCVGLFKSEKKPADTIIPGSPYSKSRSALNVGKPHQCASTTPNVAQNQTILCSPCLMKVTCLSKREKKMKLLCLGGVEEKAREVENGAFSVRGGKPLRSSRERWCLAATIQTPAGPDT